MSLSVRPYSETDADTWDQFCFRALQSTLLHTRRFLSYHRHRFDDCSLIIEDNGKWVGLFPAALSTADPMHVVSHPGITYGGVLHQGYLRGERMVSVLKEICRYYRERGLRRLTYKSVPTFYQRAPAQDDLYALFRIEAVRTRCDLSCTIDLEHRISISNRRLKSHKRAIKSGIEIVSGGDYLENLWDLLTKNLETKYGVKPTHNLEEISFLAEEFPEQVLCICGCLAGSVVAGILLFVTPTAYHTQYIASSELGYQSSALDLIIEHAIELATKDNRRWFDFGISNEQQGRFLNDGLYKYKSEFGGGGSTHEFYEINLIEGGIDASQ